MCSERRRGYDLYTKAKEADDPYDVVIMDLTIRGGMGGKETIKRLLEINPNVKAIVSSGYSNDPVMAKFKEYGFLGVVQKPYIIKDMLDEVQRLIDISLENLADSSGQGREVEKEVGN